VDRVAERPVRGEIVVVVEGRPGGAEPEADEAAVRTLAEALLAQGLAPSAVAKELRDRLRISRNEAYQLVQEISSER
jgi:16S rRNA C1402 (ribose-2'-O) methylase RsmI